ncbi:nuclear transport factor 2 family protein [Aeromicrobium sp. S22]|uniref:nuclear transport factor 2 family protein n=1 Tax=Aeromicrobium sp. S22 TaxID=2662029 RepID=UPI00129E4834|nr:nuclear transport factor 2 family protein [Aeromicrobium sp. S22]MRK01710.1 nuclear transport factor 2 family protein [Aeromicrobium sp. S22]
MELWELLAREQVRDVYAAYTHSGDRFRLEDLADCFTQDGILEVKDRNQAQGRGAIVEMLSGGSRVAQPPADGSRTFIRHFIANIRFDSVTTQRIETSAYFQVLTAAGLDHWGRYRDVFVPAEGRWLIQHRLAALDASVADSWLANR